MAQSLLKALTRASQALGAAFVLVALAPAVAPAQTAQQDSVTGRARPDFDPVGMQLDQLLSTVGLVSKQEVENSSSGLSSFLVFPKVEISTEYETNLFRDQTKVHDRVVVVRPELAIKSDWDRHSLSLVIDGAMGRHDRSTKEDYNDVRATVSGRLDATDDASLSASAQIAKLHVKRGTLLDPGHTGGATVYTQSTFVLTGRYTGDAFRGLVELTTTGTQYENNGGIDNGDLDRVINRVRVRGGYEILPGTAWFVEPSLNTRHYTRARDQSGLLQDSDGWQLLTGLTWDVSGVTFAEFGLGYLRQVYDDPALPTVQGPSFSGKLIWNPAYPWTVTADVTRTVQETLTAGVSGVLSTRVDARVDFELSDDTLLALRGARTVEAYNGLDRTDDRYLAEFEVKHYLNQYFSLRFLAGYDKLNSDVTGAGFSNMRGTLALTAHI